jgi:transcriptional regulator GlxA family with amidase domain
VRALVHRDDERASALRARDVEVIVGDLLDSHAVQAALQGVTGAYFVYPVMQAQLIDATAYFAHAAKLAAFALLGPEAAKTVARLLVMNQRRLGGQEQHSALLDMTPKSDRIESVLAHIRRNMRNALTVEELATVANLSPRQFSRSFLAETGLPPAKAVEQLRLEAARFMIEQGRHTINVVANETGFADRERMRRAFLRTFGVPADVLRRNARTEPVDGR